MCPRSAASEGRMYLEVDGSKRDTFPPFQSKTEHNHEGWPNCRPARGSGETWAGDSIRLGGTLFGCLHSLSRENRRLNSRSKLPKRAGGAERLGKEFHRIHFG